MRYKNLKKCATGLMLLLIGVGLVLYSQPATGQSLDVAIVGTPSVWHGGVFPTSANLAFSAFNFTNLPVSAVNATNLANYDTVLLNVGGSGTGAMYCNMNSLSTQAKADLVDWVEDGNKLIIYDSECTPQDYSWLPFQFTTSNPGPRGATGPLTIVEDNELSTLVGDPTCTSGDARCINANLLGFYSDAVGDMNVMTTFDPNWCVDMSGTNYLGTTGPVHTYAKTGVDEGLIIYNGLDMDYLFINSDPNNPSTPGNNLAKIWLQELQQPFNPSLLPCGTTVVGITLNPATATNAAGEDHTVTANLTDLLGDPQAGIEVTFEVLSGPNAGATGTCSSNSDCTTDADGDVSFTYTGDGGAGTDVIEACFLNQVGDEVCSQTVTKDWINNAPVADPNGPYLCAVGQSCEFDGSASSDPDGDPLDYYWNFGNGNDGTGVTPSHTYESAGIYEVCLTVTDVHGGCASSCTIAVVYDPEAGFVTGGGWIYSEAGAYFSDSSLAGKAVFGFVSKYKKGATAPTGNTEFQFQTAGMNFHSDSYDWLVVAGAKAMYKGIGTINNEGEYKFILSAIDADLSTPFTIDRFRIRIWQEDASGSELVIYDNAIGDDSDEAMTEINGGSIVIHTKKK